MIEHQWYFVNLRFGGLRHLTNENRSRRLIRRVCFVMLKVRENHTFADRRIHQTNSARKSRLLIDGHSPRTTGRQFGVVHRDEMYKVFDRKSYKLKVSPP